MKVNKWRFYEVNTQSVSSAEPISSSFLSPSHSCPFPMHTHWYELPQYLKLSGSQIRQDTNPVEILIFLTACPYFPPWKYWVTTPKHGSLINCSTRLGHHQGHPELTFCWINMYQLESYPTFWVRAFCAIPIICNAKPCMSGHLKSHPYCCASVPFSWSSWNFVNN